MWLSACKSQLQKTHSKLYEKSLPHKQMLTGAKIVLDFTLNSDSCLLIPELLKGCSKGTNISDGPELVLVYMRSLAAKNNCVLPL